MPTWETTPGALSALLTSGAPVDVADAYTLTPRGASAPYRWSGLDRPFALGSRQFALGPLISRSRTAWSVGVDVGKLTLTLRSATVQMAGQPLHAYLCAGGLEGAAIEVERVFFAGMAAAPTGALPWFVGEVADMDGHRDGADLTCASYTQRLAVQVPGGLYQTNCLNTLGDPMCGINLAAQTISSAATGPSDGWRTSFPATLAKPDGWGDMGQLTFTGGANAGITRTCKRQAGGQLSVTQFWPLPVAAGDAFTLVAGCDGLAATCTAKFANRARFRATPLVPDPRTAL